MNEACCSSGFSEKQRFTETLCRPSCARCHVMPVWCAHAVCVCATALKRMHGRYSCMTKQIKQLQMFQSVSVLLKYRKKVYDEQ